MAQNRRAADRLLLVEAIEEQDFGLVLQKPAYLNPGDSYWVEDSDLVVQRNSGLVARYYRRE